MYNESTKKATIKYMKDKREKLTLNLATGKKEIWKNYAKNKGYSLTEYIDKLIKEDNND